LMILWFEHRALYLLGKCSTTWITPPSPFAFRLFFRWGLAHISPRLAWDHNHPTYASCKAGITGTYPDAWLVCGS
jgi:hypothetical protein